MGKLQTANELRGGVYKQDHAQACLEGAPSDSPALGAVSLSDKQLRRLRRVDLLEMLVEQGRELERTRAELERTRAQLADRRIAVENCGSIAEAALALNKVFEAAQAAADQYLENVARVDAREQSNTPSSSTSEATYAEEQDARRSSAHPRHIRSHAESSAINSTEVRTGNRAVGRDEDGAANQRAANNVGVCAEDCLGSNAASRTADLAESSAAEHAGSRMAGCAESRMGRRTANHAESNAINHAESHTEACAGNRAEVRAGSRAEARTEAHAAHRVVGGAR